MGEGGRETKQAAQHKQATCGTQGPAATLDGLLLLLHRPLGVLRAATAAELCPHTHTHAARTHAIKLSPRLWRDLLRWLLLSCCLLALGALDVGHDLLHACACVDWVCVSG